MKRDQKLLDDIIAYIVDIVYILDFIICFFKGYYDDDMNIIRNNKDILMHYLTNNFFMDLLEAIPFNFFIKMGLAEFDKYYGFSDIKLILFKSFLFIKPFKIIKIISKKNDMILEELLEQLNEYSYLESIIINIFNLFLFFLFIHLFICLHIFISLQSYPNWVSVSSASNQSFSFIYIASFYFLFTTMTTVGYGDIVCISFTERCFHIILLSIGTIFYTFLVSKIGNYLGAQSREQIKLANNLQLLEQIRITYPSMTYTLYFKIKNHLLNSMKRTKKTGINSLINGIPDAVKTDLLFKIYSKIINKFTIFKNVNNSNFIIQVLTSFIPLILKKDEIILFEGEVVENIIFVKDGKISMEITIDLKEPFTSIQNYLDLHFIGINKKNLVQLNAIQSVNSLLSKKEHNYKDLKAKIDNFILNNQKNMDNKELNDYISTDLGKLNLSRKYTDLNNFNYKLSENIKIFDIRKNENFGEVHMFEEKPSPFTLRIKSRIVEVLLLRKQEALSISNNFPNIWRKFHSTSFHNLVSLKNVTFKTLKQYYNSHFYNKKKKEKNLNFNLDVSTSFISISDNQFHIRIHEHSSKKSIVKSIKKDCFNNNLKEKKNSKINLSNDIIKLKHDSSFGSGISSFTGIQNFIPKSSRFNAEHYNKNKLKEKVQFTFRKKDNNSDNTIIKSADTDKRSQRNKEQTSQLNTSRNGQNFNTSIEYYKEIIKSMNESKSKEDIKTLISQPNEIDKKNYSSSIDNEKIFTLKDLNKDFSDKIKKKLKKRKKIEKIKHSLELKRKEKHNILVEFYSNIISRQLNSGKQNNDISKNIAEELIDRTTGIYDSEIFSQIMDSKLSEEKHIKRQFDNYSLEIIESESFQIKSCYNNFNNLSKGEIINNSKLQQYLEVKIYKFFNKKKVRKVHFSKNSKISEKKKRELKQDKSLNLLIKKTKDLSSINFINPDIIINNNYNERPSSKKIKKGKTKMDQTTYNLNKSNLDDNKKEIHQKENNKTNKNNKIRTHILNELTDHKKIFQQNNKQNNNSFHNKSYSSSLNFISEIDKDKISKNENNNDILNKNNYEDNSEIKIIHIHDDNKKCMIF